NGSSHYEIGDTSAPLSRATEPDGVGRSESSAEGLLSGLPQRKSQVRRNDIDKSGSGSSGADPRASRETDPQSSRRTDASGQRDQASGQRNSHAVRHDPRERDGSRGRASSESGNAAFSTP